MIRSTHKSRVPNSAANPSLSAPAQDSGERLSKRVMQLKACSRREAELYIEGGWVSVDGVVVQDPPFRVTQQMVRIDSAATLLGTDAVTFILHKPAGWLDGVEELQTKPQTKAKSARSLLIPANHWTHDSTGVRMLKRHFSHLDAEIPLETGASGLVVFTQDWRTTRKLSEDAGSMEHELVADVAGDITIEALQKITRILNDDRLALPATKCSVNSSSPERSKLRFAIKGAHPGLVAYVCEKAGLQLLALRRIRLGRVALSDLPAGQWRYLGEGEKF